MITTEIKYCNECKKETNHIKENHVFPVKQIKYKCCKCKVKDWETILKNNKEIRENLEKEIKQIKKEYNQVDKELMEIL